MTTFVDPSTGVPDSELDQLVEHATKVLRVASAIIAIDEELDRQPIGPGTARRLARLEVRLLIELASALSDAGQEELAALVRTPDPERASEKDVRIGFAQLAGWVRGLVAAPMSGGRVVVAGIEAAA